MSQNLPYNALFDGPSASTVVPAESGMWEQPLGFIANRRSGTVIPLDLQHNSPFSDQLTAPFLRPRGIAMGQMRQISDIHVDVPSVDQLTVYVLDQYSQSLVIALLQRCFQNHKLSHPPIPPSSLRMLTTRVIHQH